MKLSMSLNTHFGSLSRNSSLTSSPTPTSSPPPPHHCHLHLHHRRPATNTMLALPIEARPSIDERDLHQRTSKVPKSDLRSPTPKKSARETRSYDEMHTESHAVKSRATHEGRTRLDGIVLGCHRWSWLRHPPFGRCHGGREPLWRRR